MNEVRQAWSSFRSSSRSSASLRSSYGNGHDKNDGADNGSTWYDVPAPVIVHCREFREDRRTESDAPVPRTDATKPESTMDEVTNEALYQNNEELLANRKEVRVPGSWPSSPPPPPPPPPLPSPIARTEQGNREKKHRTSLELTASTSVKTSADGVPTISFSFLRAEAKSSSNVEDDVLQAKDSTMIDARLIESDELYDLPRKSREKEDTEEKESTVGKDMVAEPAMSSSSSSSTVTATVETQEVAKSTDRDRSKESLDSRHRCSNGGGRVNVEAERRRELMAATAVVAATLTSTTIPPDRRYEVGRSTRSLRSNGDHHRRSRDSRDVASMSDGYSDPECPNDDDAVARIDKDRCRRMPGRPIAKSQTARLGKAWGKMRSWLRDERTKIGQVVNRHARMQAVGALTPQSRYEDNQEEEEEEEEEEGEEENDEEKKVNSSSSRNERGKRAFYDLTKARLLDLGSITRVEEFGVNVLSELDSSKRKVESFDPEGAFAERITPLGSKGKDEGQEEDETEKKRSSPSPASFGKNKSIFSSVVKRTASSDDVLSTKAISEDGRASIGSRLPLVSVSMDKLCSEPELDEETCNTAMVTSVAVPTTPGNGFAAGETEPRDHAGKGSLIKRRMLGSIRGLMASTHLLQPHEIEEGGQGGFEDVRRYIKQGGDFCKELAAILHERAELEATYAKGLSKLSGKLTKACTKDQGGNTAGGVNEAWRCVGEEMEAAAEAHRIWGIALSEQLAKPLRVGVAEAQGRSRKTIENSVDKASKSLQEWRGIAAKSKKQSFACARENERLQDLARLQSISQSQQNNNKLSNHHMTEKEASKLEARRRKAEDSSRRADTEFYTVSVRAERARVEYESTVRKGANQMELLEEERLSALKDFANVYLAHLQAFAPRLQQSADRLSTPVRNCNVSQDVEILKNLIRRIDSNDMTNAEQLLPDFYAEHITLAMNRERRKQSLVRVLHLIRQDLEREKRGREGLETLHRAFIKTPAFAADESTQNVTEKLHHMRSMLMYLEAARYKVGGTLAEVEGSKRGKHPLAEHILVSRDKQGLQQSVLKIPSWVKNESFEIQDDDELEAHLVKDHEVENRDWADRTAGDGISENPPDEDFSDFDEFSSHSEDNNNQDVDVADVVTAKVERTEQCRAIYQYSANLNDELSLNPGDLITVHQKQADGWWIGECRGRTGIFPATYVQVIN